MQIKISDKDVTEGLKEEDFAPTKYYLFLKKAQNPLEKEEKKKDKDKAHTVEGEVLTPKDL